MRFTFSALGKSFWLDFFCICTISVSKFLLAYLESLAIIQGGAIFVGVKIIENCLFWFSIFELVLN